MVVISVTCGSWGGVNLCLAGYRNLGSWIGGTKSGGRSRVGEWGKQCGGCWVLCIYSCACLGIFLILQCRVLVSGMSGSWDCVKLV
jgi:hypothetical protein